MRSGVILVNKPRGLTSNKVVNIVKYFVGATKAGHLGTLDKLGEGLLPVTINGATKLFDKYLDKDKIYESTFKFGETSPSFDLETEVTKTDDCHITKNDIEKILPEFVGKFSQLPPKYSAKNINGKRAYSLVHENIDFDVKPKDVEIYSLKLIEEVEENKFKFKIHCSSGTYIRSLCRDMATRLSTYGVMYDITRTKCGNFSLENAFSLKDVEQGKYELIPLDSLFNYEKINLSVEEKNQVLQGIKLKRIEPDKNYLVYCENVFFGVGYIKNGELRMWIKD